MSASASRLGFWQVSVFDDDDDDDDDDVDETSDSESSSTKGSVNSVQSNSGETENERLQNDARKQELYSSYYHDINKSHADDDNNNTDYDANNDITTENNGNDQDEEGNVANQVPPQRFQFISEVILCSPPSEGSKFEYPSIALAKGFDLGPTPMRGGGRIEKKTRTRSNADACDRAHSDDPAGTDDDKLREGSKTNDKVRANRHTHAHTRAHTRTHAHTRTDCFVVVFFLTLLTIHFTSLHFTSLCVVWYRAQLSPSKSIKSISSLESFLQYILLLNVLESRSINIRNLASRRVVYRAE